MSHEPLDDEVKAILAQADTDDSKESNKDVQEQPPIKDKEIKKETKDEIDYDGYNTESEIDDKDPLEDKTMDDKKW